MIAVLLASSMEWRSLPPPLASPKPTKFRKCRQHVRDAFRVIAGRVSLPCMSRKAVPSELPYRPCVGMMVLNASGRIFVGKRIDKRVEAWQMPQGGIGENENPRAAALRELQEEIGTKNIEILREHGDWLTYDLPEHLIGLKWNGRYRGQVQKWFAMRFLGSDSEINLKTHHEEFSEWRWVGRSVLLEKIVAFKRPIYEKVLEAFHDLIDVPA